MRREGVVDSCRRPCTPDPVSPMRLRNHTYPLHPAQPQAPPTYTSTPPSTLNFLDGWSEFMMGIQVLTFEASQPRKRTPISVIYAILRVVNLAVFWEVQCVFLILTVLFTYTRSECPCPKKATGRDSYDMDAHFKLLCLGSAQISAVVSPTCLD